MVNATISPSLEMTAVPHVSSPSFFPPRACEPLDLSPIPPDTDITTYHTGLSLMGLGATPQGVDIASVMESVQADGRPSHRRVAVQLARRSGKTTSIGAVILGRLQTREKYRVAVTAQTGKIARLLWLDLVAALDLAYADMDHDQRPYDVRLSNGDERLLWRETGSTLVPRPPSPLAFRSQAFDLIWVDEAGHIRSELAASIKAGVLPTMDTRPYGQIVFSGTPGVAREGLLWESLEMGRAGRAGIVNYGASETDDISDPETWYKAHPGLASGMTSEEIIRERFDEMPAEDFAAEYLGRWRLSSSITAIDEGHWLASGTGDLAKPEKFCLAVDVEPNGDSAAVVAAWRDETGKAHILLIDHRSGSGWAPGVVADLVKRHPRTPVGADNIGAVTPVIEALTKRRPSIKVTSPQFRALQGACMGLVREIENGNLVHSDQPELNTAAKSAVWRERDGGRLFGRKASRTDVSPLVAAAIALWVFDNQPARRSGAAIIAA